MEERRDSKRINLKIDIEINISSKQENLKFQSKDISKSGICIIANKPIDVNTIISTSFILPDTKDIIIIEGVIVWVREDEKKLYHMGIKFTSILGKYKDMIEKYINNITFEVNKRNF